MDDQIGDLVAAELAGEVEDPQSDPLEVAAAKRANTIDQVWFKRHPARAYRVRAPVPNEFPDACRPAVGTERLVVLVKQVRPGTRLRCPLWADRWPSTDDDCLARAWLAFVPERVKQIALDIAAILLSEGEMSLDVYHALRTPRPPRGARACYPPALSAADTTMRQRWPCIRLGRNMTVIGSVGQVGGCLVSMSTTTTTRRTGIRTPTTIMRPRKAEQHPTGKLKDSRQRVSWTKVLGEGASSPGAPPSHPGDGFAWVGAQTARRSTAGSYLARAAGDFVLVWRVEFGYPSFYR